MTIITADALVSNEGSVLLFDGHNDHDEPVRFAVDHRPGWALAEVLEERGPVLVEVAPWQLL